MKTQHDKLVAGLLTLGYEEQHTTSRKYRAFRHPNHPEARTLWVGRAGALRRGRIATQTTPTDDQFRYKVMCVGANLLPQDQIDAFRTKLEAIR